MQYAAHTYVGRRDFNFMKVKIRISVIHLLISVGKFSVIVLYHREVRGQAQLQDSAVETGEAQTLYSETDGFFWSSGLLALTLRNFIPQFLLLEICADLFLSVLSAPCLLMDVYSNLCIVPSVQFPAKSQFLLCCISAVTF